MNSMKISIIIAAIVLCFSFVAVHAQSAKADEFSAQASAAVTEFEINGLKVIVKRRPSAPTVAGGLFIRGGARNIDAKTAGIEKLMLAAAADAGQKIPRAVVRRDLARLGSGISFGINNDFSVISFATTRTGFDRVWEIFSDVSLNPAFAAEDVDRNREQLLSGLREAGISPESELEKIQKRVVYTGHPYANDVNGTVANLSRFTPAELRAYHKSVMETSRLLFVFVGDLDVEQLKTRIAATFGKLPRGNYKQQSLPALDFSKGTLDISSRPLPTNYIQGAFAAPTLSDADYHAMRVATSILSTLVNQEVRVRRQLSYAPSADMYSEAANTGNISVSTTDANQAVAVMLDQIKLLQTRTLNSEIIDEIAAFLLTRHYIGQETNAAQAAELARYELIGGGWRNSFDFLKGIRSVKPEDVQRVSKRYMKNIRFAFVGGDQGLNRSVFLPGE